MAGTQNVAPARPPAPPQPDESSRRSRAQAARTNPPAGPQADWARQQSQAAGPRVPLVAGQAAGVVELKGNAAFAPPAAVAEQLAAHRGAAPVDVRFGSLAAGSIRVRRRKDRYDTAGDAQAIALMHPVLDPLVSAGVTPLLVVQVRDSLVTGFVTIGQGKRALPSGRAAIFDTIRKKPDALGWLGIGDLTLPEQVNRLEAGVLTLQTGLRFTLGGFLSASGRFGLADDVVTFNASARATVAGLAPVALDVHRAPDGTLGGQVKVPITYGKFSGGLIASLSGGVVEAIGTVSYNTEKLSGTVTVQVTDAATAREVAKRLLPPSAIQAEAAQAAGTAPGSRAPVPAGPRKGPRAIAGWGTLNAHFSSWLTGTATVIVDGAGYVTVVGKITPPAYVPLFKTGARPRFFDVNPRFGFGVPYVARAYVGANIWLGAIATIDASLSQIEIAGVYSTDPTIFNEFSIVGTLRVAALAGLEGGVAVEGGLELLGHDVSVGAGIDLTAGLVGQLEARPTIAYRELADPQAGRRGEFSISGYVEIGAQPFLALAGRAWIKLDSPFWSPAPDKTWPKELFSREYMLGGPFGYGVDFTYVIGSGKFPELKPRKPGFDGKALMSDLMDDNVPTGSQSKRKVPATWKEKTPPAPPAPAPPPVTPGPPTRAGRRAGSAAERMTPKPEHAKRWSAGMKAIGELTQDARKRPLAKEEIDRRLGSIQARYGFARLEAKPNGKQWDIYAKLGDTSNEHQPATAMRAVQPAGAQPGLSAPQPAPARPVVADLRAERALLALHKRIQLPDGKQHTLSFRRSDRRPLLMIASTPAPLEGFVRSIRVRNPNPDRDFLLRLVERIGQLEDHAIATNTDNSAAIASMLEDVGRTTARLMNQAARIDLRTTQPEYGGLFAGFGRGVRVTLLTNELNVGSRPSVAGGRFTALNLRRRGNGAFYMLGHLLSEKLGGRGDTWLNLTPISRSANRFHEDHVERIVKPTVGDTPRAFIYVVTAAYGRSLQTALLAQIAAPTNPDSAAAKSIKSRIVQEEQFVPAMLVCTIRELDPLSGRRGRIDETYSVAVNLPQSSPADYEI